MAGVTRPDRHFDHFTFDVFISYSRRDAPFARTLQRALDNYTPPGDLPLPHRRLRTFRDESDFRGNEYGQAIEATLGSSATLLVICSPDSRASTYVGGEIATFASVRGPEHIVSLIADGHPNNEASRGDAGMAFHDELVRRLPVPLAADYRGFDVTRDRIDRDRFESAWYKLLADIYAVYGVERSAIEGREKLRQQRTRRIRTAVVSVLFVVLASLTIWALVSRNQAIVQGNTARSRFLAVQSMSGTHPFDVAMLLAVAAYRTTPTFEAWEALFVGLRRQPNVQRFLHGVDGTVDQIVVATGGTCAAAWIDRRHTIVWDLPGGTRRIDVPGRAVPDGSCSVIVVASEEGTLEARSLQSDAAPLWSAEAAGGSVTAWATDPTGTVLAMGHAGGRLLVRDMTDGRILAERSDGGSTWRYVRFSSDGQALAAVDQDAMIHRWDATTLEAQPPARPCDSMGTDVFAVSPDLRWCAAGGPGRFTMSDLTRDAGEVDLGTPWIIALDFSPDGRTLMAGVQGGALQFRAMDDIVRDGERARPVIWSEHRSDVTAAVYAPDGRTIISAARDGTAIAWSPNATNRLISEVDVSTESWSAIAADANAPGVAIGTPTGDILVSRDSPAGPFETLANLGEEVTALAWRADGEVLAGTVTGRLVGVTPGASLRVFSPEPRVRIQRIRLNDDRTRAAVMLADGRVTVWDTAAGTLGATIGERRTARNTPGSGLQPDIDAAFEPGGSRIVSVHGDREAFLWNATDASPQPSALPFTPTSYVTSVAFAAVGSTIALGTGMYEEEIVLLDPSRADAPLARLPSHNSGKIAVTALAFSPDARVLFSGLFDGSMTAWDVAGRRRIGDIHAARGEVTDLRYAQDGSAVTAVTDRGVVLRWNLDADDWLTLACAIANRDVSSEERARFLEGGSSAAICP